MFCDNYWYCIGTAKVNEEAVHICYECLQLKVYGLADVLISSK